MRYIVYEITNLVNGKIYIGCHKTKDSYDTYMGSGKIVKRAIEKYGIEKFAKRVIAEYDSPEEMYDVEAILVNQEFIDRKDTYNIRLGGHGGFDYINRTTTPEHRTMLGKLTGQVHIERLYSDPHYMRRHADNSRRSLENARRDGLVRHDGMKGKTHTDETKAKMSKAQQGKQKGERNSQYGLMWITNGTETTKIDKGSPIPEGWCKGRTYKDT